MASGFSYAFHFFNSLQTCSVVLLRTSPFQVQWKPLKIRMWIIILQCYLNPLSHAPGGRKTHDTTILLTDATECTRDRTHQCCGTPSPFANAKLGASQAKEIGMTCIWLSLKYARQTTSEFVNITNLCSGDRLWSHNQNARLLIMYTTKTVLCIATDLTYAARK